MRTASEEWRQRRGWVVLGLTTTLTAAIVFALWASSLSNRTAVVVAGRDIPSGSSIGAGDLRAVEVASDPGASLLPVSQMDSIIGRTVRSAIPEGTVLHPGLLSEGSPLASGEAVVGAVLQPGEYPIAHLDPGQQVGVVVTGDHSADADGRHAQGGQPPPSMGAATARATVAHISEVEDAGRRALFVSLLTAAKDAVHISNAAASRDLRLILLPAEPPAARDVSIHRSAAIGNDR